MPNIPVYAIVFLLIVLVFAAVSYNTLETKYEMLDLKHRNFVAETKVEGDRAKLKQEKLTKAYDHLAKQLELKSEEMLSNMRKSHAEYERLRNDKSASSNGVRTLAEGATTANCGTGKARLAGALEHIEKGVLARLVFSRDEAIARNIVCKKYVEELEALQK